jgi:hypothetical protein
VNQSKKNATNICDDHDALAAFIIRPQVDFKSATTKSNIIGIKSQIKIMPNICFSLFVIALGPFCVYQSRFHIVWLATNRIYWLVHLSRSKIQL